MFTRRANFIVAIALVLTFAGLFWAYFRYHAHQSVRIVFLGYTNNTTALLGTSDKVLAVFSVTNLSDSPVMDSGFYYIEMAGLVQTYSPLGSSGAIPSHGSGTILTRISTNGIRWRVLVPYRGRTLSSEILEGATDKIDRLRGRPNFDFRRYGLNAPASDWVKP